jgi:hypothetical protein
MYELMFGEEGLLDPIDSKLLIDNDWFIVNTNYVPIYTKHKPSLEVKDHNFYIAVQRS